MAPGSITKLGLPHVHRISRELSSVFERLSSGLRITRASDDPAGLSVSAQLSSRARIERRGLRNVNDSTSLFNVVDSALDALTSIVTRQRELAQQAATSTYAPSQRLALHQEADGLREEYNRIVLSASFNELKVLDGSLPSLHVQAGNSGYTLDGVAFDASSVTIGDGTFQAAVTFVAGSNPQSVIFADLNGDGRPDLVSADGAGRLSVFFGNGDGTFQAATTVVTGSNPQSVVAADVNGDGTLDLVSADGGSNRLSVFLGNGNGTFKAATTAVTGSNPQSVIAADVNGDGTLDLVSADGGSNRLSVFFGNGNGTFKAAMTLVTGSTPQSVIAADVNGDGTLDLVSADAVGNRLSVFFGNGDGTFKAVTTLATGVSPQSIVAADVNGDGKFDLVSADSGSSRLSVFFGNGDGTFQAATTLATGSFPRAVIAADVNVDGTLDLVSADRGSNRLSVFFGNGNGTFQAVMTLATGNEPRSVTAADVNGDGVLDLVSADYFSNQRSIFIQNASTVDTPGGILQEELDLTTPAAALAAGNYLSSLADTLGNARATVGANLSRLETTLSTLAESTDSLERAARRILDVDVAEEMAKLVRLQVTQQAHTALFAQAAGLQRQMVLQLLGDVRS